MLYFNLAFMYPKYAPRYKRSVCRKIEAHQSENLAHVSLFEARFCFCTDFNYAGHWRSLVLVTNNTRGKIKEGL